MGRIMKSLAALTGIAAAAEAAGTAYFYRRTMKRSKAKDRTNDEDVRDRLDTVFSCYGSEKGLYDGTAS